MGLKPSPFGTQLPFEEKDYKVDERRFHFQTEN